MARGQHRGQDRWLIGEWSLADVFHASVAALVATYGLPVGPAARHYVVAQLAHPSFRH